MKAAAPVLLLAVLLLSGSVRSAPPASMSEERKIDHLLHRATFGLTVTERERARSLGRTAWLREQLDPAAVDADLEALLALYPHYGLPPAGVQAFQREHDYAVTAGAGREANALPVLDRLQERRFLADATSRLQLRESMVEFWFNHFNVDWTKSDLVQWSLPSYVEGDVRPRALGRFRDLLGAVARSPAMLVYLDNWVSSAPAGLNENYARELLELHTLGVEAGYTQRDVQEVARAFSGWSVALPDLRFHFDELRHDDGPKVLLGALRLPRGGGVEDGERVLDFLASHPATARRLCRKLAQRFVDEEPPPEVVDRAVATWLRTDGDIARVLETLLTAPEFYAPERFRSRLRSPLELVVGTLRAVGVEPRPGAVGNLARTRLGGLAPSESLNRFGTPLFKCQLPIGYPDLAEAWTHPAALQQRVQFAASAAETAAPGLVRRVGADVDALAREVLPAGVGGATLVFARSAAARSVRSEEAAQAALAVLLASPEFGSR